MGLGPKVTVPLGFLASLRGLVRPRAPLELLWESWNLWGSGGAQRSKKGGIDGFGPQGNYTTWFFVLFEGFV